MFTSANVFNGKHYSFVLLISILCVLFVIYGATSSFVPSASVDIIRPPSCSLPSDTMAAIEERVWIRKRNMHSEYKLSRDVITSKAKWADISERDAYDTFEPEWNCEDEVRLGASVVSVGDGPKFVCGPTVLASAENCVVYSIGSNYDFSFEYAVHRIAPQCEIHTFDGTLDLSKRALPEGLEEKHINFHNWNIISDCQEQSGVGISSMCVAETLKKLNHDTQTITWLKVDCEGCEFTVIPKFFASSVKIEQVMVEMHGVDAGLVAGAFRSLHDAGMMIFHKERNHWGCEGYLCVEYSLVSSSYARRVIHKYLSDS